MRIRLLTFKSLIKDLKIEIKSINQEIFTKIKTELGEYKKLMKFSHLILKKKYYLINKRIFHGYFFTISKYILSTVKGTFLEIYFLGLGYKSYQLNNYLFLDLNFSHKIYYLIPEEIVIRTYKKRILLFSLNKVKLFNEIKKILSLKPINIYTGKGLSLTTKKIKLKQGKKR